jgi:hypothetical protein
MSTSSIWAHLLVVPEDGSEQFEMGVRHVDPLALEDLLDLSGPHRVVAFGPLMRGTGTSGEVGREERVRLNVSLRSRPTIFTLIRGGWLPPSLIGHRILLLDRNVFHRLTKYATRTGRIEDQASAEDLLGSGATFNLGLCAQEGSKRREPSWEEYVASYAEASRTFAAALPSARFIEPTSLLLQAGYQNILDVRKTYASEIRFLCEVSPLLVEPVRRAERRPLEDRLFEAATESELPRSSFALVLALGCLYGPGEDASLAIARRVLNPRRVYDSGDAHNAIADLRCLQFAAMGIGMAGDGIAFCTSDLALAKLWCALGPGRGAWNGRRFDLTLSLSAALFSALDDENLARLGSRIALFHATAPVGFPQAPSS